MEMERYADERGGLPSCAGLLLGLWLVLGLARIPLPWWVLGRLRSRRSRREAGVVMVSMRCGLDIGRSDWCHTMMGDVKACQVCIYKLDNRGGCSGWSEKIGEGRLGEKK